MIFLDGLIQQDDAPHHATEMLQEHSEEHNNPSEQLIPDSRGLRLIQPSISEMF